MNWTLNFFSSFFSSSWMVEVSGGGFNGGLMADWVLMEEFLMADWFFLILSPNFLLNFLNFYLMARIGNVTIFFSFLFFFFFFFHGGGRIWGEDLGGGLMAEMELWRINGVGRREILLGISLEIGWISLELTAILDYFGSWLQSWL